MQYKSIFYEAIETGYDMNHLPDGLFKDSSETNKCEGDKEKDKKDKAKNRRFNFRFKKR